MCWIVLLLLWCIVVTCTIAIPRAAAANNSTAAFESDEATVVFTHNAGLDSLNLMTLSAHELFENGDTFFDVDALYVGVNRYRLFWSDLQRSRIYGAMYAPDEHVLKDVQEVAVVSNGVGVIEGIAVDWKTLNVYWVDSRFGLIGVVGGVHSRMTEESQYDTTSVTLHTLLTDTDSPRAIAVDSNAGLLFWTDWHESDPRIERCSLSGVERSVVVRTSHYGGGFPNGLAIDYSRRTIYWIDAKSSGIYSTDYEGHRHSQLLANSSWIQWPFGLSIYGDKLFWVDAELKTVNQIEVRNTTSDVHVLYKTYRTLYGIQVLHPRMHSTYDASDMNPCANNGGCSHMCTVESGGRRSACHCPHMMSLDSRDSRTCHNVRDVMLVSESRKGSGGGGVNVIQVLDAGSLVFRVTAFPLVIDHADDHVYGLNIDLSTGIVYWADGHSNTVWRASISDGKITRVFDLGFGNLTGVATDIPANKVFYSMMGPHGGIYECHLLRQSNRRCRRILSHVVRPLRLFFQLELRELYWIESHVNDGHDVFTVRTSTQNTSTGDFGDIRIVFNASTGLPGDLMVDFEGALYWTTDDDGRSAVHRLIAGGSDDRLSIMSIPKDAGVVTAMTTKNGRLTVGTSSGIVLTAINQHDRIKRQTSKDWSVIQYKSKGTVAGLAYASTTTTLTDDDGAAASIMLHDDDSPLATAIPCSITCRNGGVCRRADELGDEVVWTCDCPEGFFGSLCETSVACGELFCKRGRCETNETTGRIICVCPSDWWGRRCQYKSKQPPSHPTTTDANIIPLIDSCDPLHEDLCQNGGTCVGVATSVATNWENNGGGDNSTASPHCRCIEPYMGKYCEINLDVSSSSALRDVVICVSVVMIVALIAALVVLFICKQKWRSVKTVKVIATNVVGSSPRATEMRAIPVATERFRRCLFDSHRDGRRKTTTVNLKPIENDRQELLSDCDGGLGVYQPDQNRPEFV